MSVSANVIDQKEYLKKYLSGDKHKKKKKDKKHKKLSSKVIIIDDDVFGDKDLGIDEELLVTGEDAPQIVGEVFEELADAANVPKWRSFAVKDEPADEDNKATVKVKLEENDLWGRKASDRKVKDEFSPKRRQIKNEQKNPPKTSPDQSPPRRRGSNHTPARKRNHSPVGSNNRTTNSSTSRKRSETGRRRSNSSDNSARARNSDQSPPRKQRTKSSGGSRRGADQSPSRKQERSPSRKRRSPPRSRVSDSDASPPRKPSRRDANQTPPRRHQKSPPRRRTSDSDQSPPRKRNDVQRRDRDYAAPKRGRRDSDQSPARKRSVSVSPSRIKREKMSAAPSPPRHSRAARASVSPKKRSRWNDKKERERSLSPPPTHKPKATKTLDGKRAGLQAAQALKIENEERRRAEESVFAEMSSEISGRDAEVAVRSTGRRGRRAREAQEEDPEEVRRKEERAQQKKVLFDRWGKGLKQVEERRVQLESEAYESSKPLARYSNDEDLDRYLRDQERAEDPMLEYMRQKKKTQMKENNVPVLPTYEGSFPENRFNIPPGYRWDGVDRSNGYENRWFEVQSGKRAREEEAYKYSVEDM